MKPNEVVSRHPEMMNGALVFADTRVPVEIRIQHMKAGDALDQFLTDFPTVTRIQVIASLNMIRDTVDARMA